MPSTVKEQPPLLFRGYMPGLDVLRGAAIAEVLVYHGIDGRAPSDNFHGLARWFVYATSLGSTGVELFFVLSGFLITGLLLDSAPRPDYYRRFYFHRVCRILPAYLLILAVLKGIGIISWRYLLACVLYIANMGKLVGADSTEYGVFWSLAVEEQFYLLWPVAIRRCSTQALTRFIWLYLVVAPFARALLGWKAFSFDMFYKLWGEAEWLLVGALVAITVRTGQLHAGNIWNCFRGTLAAGLVFMPLKVLSDLQPIAPGIANLWIAPTQRLATFFLYTAVLLYVVARNTGKPSFNPIERALTFLGYISYGLYLVHQLVFLELDRWVAGTWLGTYPHNLAALGCTCLIAVAVSIVLATLSRQSFEAFFLHIKDRYKDRHKHPQAEPVTG